MKFFELIEFYHPLDYKFYKTRIINLTQEYYSIQTTVCSIVFRASIIKGRKFDEKISMNEDTLFINDFLILNPIFGVIRESIYYYRRRSDCTSSIQSHNKDINFYIYTLNNVYQYLLDSSKKVHNIILPFVQFLLGYDFLFRINSNSYKYLNKTIYKKYCDAIGSLLLRIDEKYILEQRILSYKIKLFTLSKKYQKDLRYDVIFENEACLYSNHTIIDFKKNQTFLAWKILEIKDKILHLEGKDSFWMPKEKYFYFCKFENKTIFPNYYHYSNDDFITLYGIIEKGRIVTFDIPLENFNIGIFRFYISYNDIIIEIFPSLGYFTHIPSINNGYYLSDNYIVKYIQNFLTIFTNINNLEKIFEKQYCQQLKSEGKQNIIKIRKENIKFRNKSKKKEIWIISDRPDKAGDNGEYFFRYLKEKNPKGIIIYFAIKKNCSDYKRLKHFGNVLDFSSDEYLDLILKADKIITSMDGTWLTNPFGKDRKYFRDLFHFDLIFLQNGIIKDDLSKYLHRLKKNYSLFITSSKKEYKSIFTFNYGYNRNNIILTGLPRYDNLYRLNKIRKREKIILIAPTWRINIKGQINKTAYESIYSHSFKYTDYFIFYNKLINNNRLIDIMKRYNYTGIFCLHPVFSSQYIDFTKNDIFSIESKCKYQKNLLISSLLVTDYSSIFFDFAYLRKPVIYTQFDYEDYRMNHYPNGYFDYEKDGFGHVVHDLESTVDIIINIIENNCLLRFKYLKRIRKFFTYYDQHNNDRLYKKIKNNKILGEFLKESIKPIIYILMILVNSKFILLVKKK